MISQLDKIELIRYNVSLNHSNKSHGRQCPIPLPACLPRSLSVIFPISSTPYLMPCSNSLKLLCPYEILLQGLHIGQNIVALYCSNVLFAIKLSVRGLKLQLQ